MGSQKFVLVSHVRLTGRPLWFFAVPSGSFPVTTVALVICVLGAHNTPFASYHGTRFLVPFVFGINPRGLSPGRVARGFKLLTPGGATYSFATDLLLTYCLEWGSTSTRRGYVEREFTQGFLLKQRRAVSIESFTMGPTRLRHGLVISAPRVIVNPISLVVTQNCCQIAVAFPESPPWLPVFNSLAWVLRNWQSHFVYR